MKAPKIDKSKLQSFDQITDDELIKYPKSLTTNEILIIKLALCDFYNKSTEQVDCYVLSKDETTIEPNSIAKMIKNLFNEFHDGSRPLTVEEELKREKKRKFKPSSEEDLQASKAEYERKNKIIEKLLAEQSTSSTT